MCVSSALTFSYVSYVRLIDRRVHGELGHTAPRLLARPLEVHRGQILSVPEFVDRLNQLGYRRRPKLERAGDFTVTGSAVLLSRRGGDLAGRTVRVAFAQARGPDASHVADVTIDGTEPRERVAFEPSLISTVASHGRQKRLRVSLDQVPPHLTQAVLAIEDRRFYDHPGIDPIRILAALRTNLRGDKPYLVGASTLTQQLVKNFFLSPEKTIRRKLLEQFMAIVLERRLSKDEILELYLNEVYLGQRGSFAIHGVGEAARVFFGKHVSNLTLSEAATIAGIIQAPHPYSPFRSTERALQRRNVVLGAMADVGFLSLEAAAHAAEGPVRVVSRAFEGQAPYFVDMVTQQLADRFPGLLRDPGPYEIHTTLDLHLQHLAQGAVRDGLAEIDRRRAERRPAAAAEAALIAITPDTGEILALVGGRSYDRSQFNRAVGAKRQPGSVFKPFVYLTAFEEAVAAGRTDLTPASLVADEPTTFSVGDEAWSPSNYRSVYDGPITLRQALARSRNIPAVKVAATAGFDRVAALWRRIGAGTPPQPYPSIALGVFEATPLEIATAYTVFPNQGHVQPPRAFTRILGPRRDLEVERPTPVAIARPDTTFLVTNMLRSVIDEGTGAAARRAGFGAEAAGKSGTTNDLRDAWFVGFTPELLTVVWVGLDDNTPLGLTGAQAALPIWTRFMRQALAGRTPLTFQSPEGVGFVEIDAATGEVALPSCPRTIREAFLYGTEPLEACHLHRPTPARLVTPGFQPTTWPPTAISGANAGARPPGAPETSSPARSEP